MSGNPEFRRQLWLELTPYRLAGIPLLLAGVFYIAYLADNSRIGAAMETASVVIFLGLTFLWGNRQAAESVIAEMRDRTWDWQRMSSIDPWSLSWGKLFGSTICAWYGGAFCIAVYFAATGDPAYDSIRMAAMLVLGAVFCQSSGLLAGLQLIVIKDRGYSRSFSSGFILLSLLALPAIIPKMTHKGSFFWYGAEYFKTDFLIGSLLCFDSWLIAGIYFLVREEFKFRTAPVAWPAFTLFMMIYAAGFAGNFPEKSCFSPSRLMVAFAVACVLTY